jgi:hypothetical protein
VTGERIESLRADDVDVGLLLDLLLAVGPLDAQALALEQPLVIGHQLRQSLERRSRFQNQRLHGASLPNHAAVGADAVAGAE